MNRRRLLVLGAALLAAAFLAYAFAEPIRQAVILPLAYFFWRAGQFYHAIPEQVVWAALIVVIVYIIGLTFLNLSLGAEQQKKEIVRRGQVETLSRSLERRGDGVYFKWHIANLLGDIALDILTYQERLLRGRRLRARGWEPPPEVDRYLDAGLNTTFAEYPSAGRFARMAPTANFDVDLDLVVDYLENQLEADDYDHHPL